MDVAAPARTPRSSWIEQGLRALGVGGPDAVRIESLAQALGVSKGGFYWHFDDRQALLGEMLDSWEKAGTEDVIARVEGGPADPRAKLQELFRLGPAAPFLARVGDPHWGAPRRPRRGAPATGGQPADGLPALSV